MKKLVLFAAAMSAAGAFAGVGDAEVMKWHGGAKGAFMLMFDDGWPSAFQAAIPALEERNLPGDFYIIPTKGEFKVFEKKWQEIVRTKPLVHIGNHTWTHNGFDDYDGAVQEFKKCTDYILENVPGRKPRLISYAQPGVKAGRWNINGEQEKQICREQNLIPRPDFRGRGATYHLKNKDDMLAQAKKAVREGIAECVIFHGVEVADPKRGYQDFWAMPVKEYIPFFDEVAAMRDAGELWVADHISVHSYETERKTAKVETLKKGAKGILLKVTCDADPELYVQPLTLKVEVPKSWKAASFRQGKDGKVEIVRVEDGFALVKAVPGPTPVGITESKAVPKAKALVKAKTVSKAAANAPAKMMPAAKTHWTWCGWGGGGWYWSSAADPVNPDVWYMGGDVNGIWKTEDFGKNWRFVNNGLRNYGVYSLAVAPSDRNTIYALTQDGVCASTDGAKSWTPCKDTFKSGLNISASRGGSIHAVAVDPKDAKTVYAGGGNGRAAKSTDGGRTWNELDYLSARKPEEGEVAKPASGAGYGRIEVAANKMDWKNYVRIQKFISQSGADWSGFGKISCKVFLPKDAPEGMAATIVLQSGSWTWKECPMTPLKPGQWTTVSAPLSTYTDPAKVQLLHFVVRTNGQGFRGEIGLDAFALGDGDAPLGEWDGADLEGWQVSPDKDTKSITKSFRTSRSPSTAPAGAPVGTIAVSGADSKLVLLCQQKHGLFRSTDAGRTWTHLKNAPTEARCIWWAGAKAPKTWYGAFGKNGVFVSKDDGLTWTNLNAPVANGMGARDVVSSPKNPGIIHAIVSQGFGGYIATSRDGGKSWTKDGKFKADRPANPTLPGNGDSGSMSGLENLAISPVDPDRLHMAGNWNPCISKDGGKTWLESCRGADITCFHDIRHLGTSTYGAAMDEGTCVTSDGGTTWTALCPLKWQAGLSGHHWRVLPQKLADGKTRIISTVSPWAHGHDFPVKVVVSEDGGKTFVESKGLPEYRTHANTMWGEGHGRALCADPRNPDVVYLGIDGDPEKGHNGGGVFKSTDGGRSFKQLANQPGSRRMFYGIAVDPTDPKRIVWGACGATAGVYISEDGGESWNKVPNMNDWIFNVEVTKKGTIYAGGGQLWRSDDHGKTFRAVTSFPGATAIGIAVDPANEDRVWVSASTWSGNADSHTTGVFESTDGCKTWTDITGDIGYRKPLILRYNAETKELWAAGPAAFKLKR